MQPHQDQFGGRDLAREGRVSGPIATILAKPLTYR
jgi:hypothetical protein